MSRTGEDICAKLLPNPKINRPPVYTGIVSFSFLSPSFPLSALPCLFSLLDARHLVCGMRRKCTYSHNHWRKHPAVLRQPSTRHQQQLGPYDPTNLPYKDCSIHPTISKLLLISPQARNSSKLRRNGKLTQTGMKPANRSGRSHSAARNDCLSGCQSRSPSRRGIGMC